MLWQLFINRAVMIISLQVKLAFNRSVLRSIFRNASTATETGRLFRLDKRSLLRVKGDDSQHGDASTFLQGLITNDMRHFEDGISCIYAMFLNTKGRVLYETLIHSVGERDSFLLECDTVVLSALQKHLNLYRLRKKIYIDDFSNEFKMFSVTTTSPDNESSSVLKNIIIHKDPRVHSLGSRILIPKSIEDTIVMQALGKNISLAQSEDYKYLRYQLGVGEGVEDLPPGTCIPLEANCDYLHGVSFHKGCYIGQELTARVHHTGVVRKRFMPFKFDSTPSIQIPIDSVINDDDNPAKSKVGKIKGVIKNYGLVLANVSEALHAKKLIVEGHTGVVERPSWWPIEAPKQKAGSSKNI